MSWGGKREGSGRKVGWRKGFSEQRPSHNIRAFDDEWELIKRFVKLVKRGDKDKIRQTLDELEDFKTIKS